MCEEKKNNKEYLPCPICGCTDPPFEDAGHFKYINCRVCPFMLSDSDDISANSYEILRSWWNTRSTVERYIENIKNLNDCYYCKKKVKVNDGFPHVIIHTCTEDESSCILNTLEDGTFGVFGDSVEQCSIMWNLKIHPWLHEINSKVLEIVKNLHKK